MRKIGLLVAVAFSINSYAQNANVKCGTDEAMQEYLLNHPNEANQINQDRAGLEEFTAEFVNAGIRSANTYIIPVVFHVLHENGVGNISEQQIDDAIYVLNRDFSLRNPDTIEVKSEFQPLLSDSDIEFRIAKRDPLGVPTSGIVRYVDAATNSANDGIKAGKIWPRQNYLNIFVVKNIASGAAGYTYLPGGTGASNDAIIVMHSFVGRIGTGSESRSRTLSHECGHWLNLLHTWGTTNDPGLSVNCGDDDNVSDTPNTEGNSGGCDTTLITCGSLDNVQNYMNYASCDRMFTIGQINRMHAALESSTGQRNNLWSTTNLAVTGVDQLCEARFVSSNNIVCAGNFVTFDDVSVATSSGWDWVFDTGIPNTSSIKYPYIYYYALGAHDVTLDVSLGSQSESVIKSDYIFVVDPIGQNYPYSEGFENVSSFPSTDWFVENPDGSANRWEVTSDAAFTGSKSAVVKNLGNNNGEKESLISGTIDLSQMASASFSFKYAYAQVNTSLDKVRLSFSVDCGETWSLSWLGIATIISTGASTSSAFIPTSGQWNTQTISSISTGMLEEGFLYKFELESDSGNHFYIDDVNITGVYKPFPVLESPFDGAGNLSDGPILNWKSVQSCSEYEYQIDTTNLFNSTELQTGTSAFISSNPDGTDTELQTSGLLHGQTYHWRVRAVTTGIPTAWSDIWEFTVSETGVGVEQLFDEEMLNLRIIPNPVVSNGWINFNSKGNEDLSIIIYNLLGDQVQFVYSGTSTAGNQSVPFNTEGLSSGVYFVKLAANSNVGFSKFIIR
ncbi:MAG: T9SS type A sorting domain-containing protein [Flavobacteriales bacterium]|nr:T9SS type A sorting domain-containing protein [Flavobacteriales bacterium]